MAAQVGNRTDVEPRYQDAVNLAQEVAHSDAQNLFGVFPEAIKTIIEKKLWASQRDKNGDPFESFQAFAEHRLWQGLEVSIPRLIRYCEDDPEVIRLIRGQVPEAREHGGTGANQYTKESRGSNATSASSSDRGAGYVLARLKRDRPDLAKQVIDGDMSPNAAAIEAGFRTRKIQVDANPEAMQRAVQKHMPGWRLVRDEEPVEPTDPTDQLPSFPEGGIESVRVEVIKGPSTYNEYTDEQLQTSFIDDMRSKPRFMEQTAYMFAKKMRGVIHYELWRRLGYDSLEAYIRDVVGRSPEWVSAVLYMTSDYFEVEGDD